MCRRTVKCILPRGAITEGSGSTESVDAYDTFTPTVSSIPEATTSEPNAGSSSKTSKREVGSPGMSETDSISNPETTQIPLKVTNNACV